MAGSLIDEPKAWENKPDGQYLKTFTGDLVLGSDYDRIDATYPTTTTEVYTYTLASVTVLAIRVTYQTASKKNLLSVEVI